MKFILPSKVMVALVGVSDKNEKDQRGKTGK